MSKSDSERIAGYLDGLGYENMDDKYKADLVIITTCGVRQSAEDRVYGIIPRIKNNNPKVKIILTGCLSKRIDVQKRLKNLVDIWLPIEELVNFGDQISNCHSGTKQSEVIESRDSCDNHKIPSLRSRMTESYLEINPQYSSKFSAFVPIGNGCDNFCTYCVVPHARGREVYRPALDIINEVKKLIKNGYKEITLIAQNVNSYTSIFNDQFSMINKVCNGSKINFHQLLKIINDIPGDFWLRFSTSHPKDMSDELIKVISECDKVCEYIHLPVQSGDDEILARMNRKYTVEHYLGLIDKIRRIDKIKKTKTWNPPISITTDIIVGFPGETENQFNNTLDLCKKAKFNMAYIGQYSPRPNTPAYQLKDNVTREEKKRRENELMQVIRKTSLEDNKNYLGKTVEVLVEGKNKKGEWFGKTRTFKNVELRINKVNCEARESPLGENEELRLSQFVKVEITNVQDFGIEGELII